MDKELLLETSLTDMEQSIVIGFPDTKKRQHIINTVNVSGVKYLPMIGMKTLRVAGTVTSNGSTYTPTILFLRVNYDNASTDTNVDLKGSNGKDFFIQPIEKELTDIRVRCNCLDYYYRFATFNQPDGSHIPPKAKPYVRTTDTYPPANPKKVPGVCKHILKLADYLEKTEVLA